MKNLSWIFSFANSVVGVGVLAMPFCFEKCGLVLSILMILFYAYLTKKTCEYLLRASSVSRKSTFEQIAQFSHGDLGKLIVEMSIILLLLGTLVAFQVVIGDLAPAVVNSVLGFQKTWSLRSFLMVVSCGAILPLSLIRNISSLSSLNTLSIGFYALFIAIITIMALPVLLSFQWIHEVNLWNFSFFFQILPIIAMSFTCQTQVLVMYFALPHPNMLTMTEIINKAVDLVSLIYISVGSFGYIGFHNSKVKGNILENFSPGILPDFIKLGFWSSVIISYPLLAFPVRSAINSLLFAKRKQGVLQDMISSASDYIAPEIFNLLTVGIVAGTFVVGVLVPKIEIVLSVTGALVGTFICLIVPTWLYLVNGAKDLPRRIAQAILVVSLISMVFSTMSVISSMSMPSTEPIKPVNNQINEQKMNVVRSEYKPIDTTTSVLQKIQAIKQEAERDETKNTKTLIASLPIAVNLKETKDERLQNKNIQNEKLELETLPQTEKSVVTQKSTAKLIATSPAATTISAINEQNKNDSSIKVKPHFDQTLNSNL